ncbi:MAG: serine hydrolase domain-containing protein [Bacteroidota bacterium]
MKTNYVLFCLASILFSCQYGKKSQITVDNDALKSDSLTNSLNDIYENGKLPGFAVSIFDKDSTFYNKGFGFSNISKEKEYTTASVQIIASVTKTMVGVAVMQCVENGLFNLDDNINKWLPYQVKNPNYSRSIITLRHLATHTSSIAGTKRSDKGYRFTTPLLEEKFPAEHHPLLKYYNKTENISMSDFLKAKLSSEGKWYEPGNIYTKHKPGTYYEYSNMGIALLAYIVESATGKDFATYSTENILNPLGMTDSKWDLSSVDEGKHVTYYNELLNEVPKYSIVTYPDGGLYSSVNDMTLFLKDIIKCRSGEGILLTKDSVDELLRKQFDGEELTEGICWDLSFDGLAGHPGNDFGTTTLMYFNLESAVGRILFTNVSTETEELEEAYYSIFNTLFEYDFIME